MGEVLCVRCGTRSVGYDEEGKWKCFECERIEKKEG